MGKIVETIVFRLLVGVYLLVATNVLLLEKKGIRTGFFKHLLRTSFLPSELQWTRSKTWYIMNNPRPQWDVSAGR